MFPLLHKRYIFFFTRHLQPCRVMATGGGRRSRFTHTAGVFKCKTPNLSSLIALPLLATRGSTRWYLTDLLRQAEISFSLFLLPSSFILLMIACSTPETIQPLSDTHLAATSPRRLPPKTPPPAPTQRAAPHVLRRPLCQPLHQGRI